MFVLKLRNLALIVIAAAVVAVLYHDIRDGLFRRAAAEPQASAGAAGLTGIAGSTVNTGSIDASSALQASPSDGANASSGAAHNPGGPRVIHIITMEAKSTTPDGKEIEAYLWHPGTVFVGLGETVKLDLYGVNGASHPFMIEGTNIKGEVSKGKETVVTFTGTKKGVYRLICLSHPDPAHGGPMIAYIVVQ